MRRPRAAWRSNPGRISALVLAALLPAFTASNASDKPLALEPVLKANGLVVLGDVKHGVKDRVAFFSSPEFFSALARAGVRNVAIEMPRILGRQAMGIETEEDIELFAGDVIRSGRWHFVDPDHVAEESAVTQHRVATALGRQVLMAKRLGINPIFYDFNNPLGGFHTFNDPVYRCMAELTPVTYAKLGLDGRISKMDRDAAIMRERFSHDIELAEAIVSAARDAGGGKLVVIPGYAHAVLPGGLADHLERLIGQRAAVVAILADDAERERLHDFLWEQSRLLAIDLSRAPSYFYTIQGDTLSDEQQSRRFSALDASHERKMPYVCQQFAHAQE